jgi:hypothetical protein
MLTSTAARSNTAHTTTQGSTELWEWDTTQAADAFMLHDRIMRSYLSRFYGYEVRKRL